MRAALAIAALIVSATLGGAARAQTVSPGPLARAHEGLEGVVNCTKCHELGKGVTNARCLECHDEIAARLAAGKGYHATARARGKSECAGCHREHIGRDISLVEWPEDDRAKFPHADAGFALEGAHRALDCARCHAAGKVRDAAIIAKLGPTGDLGATFLGLDASCVACHEDVHRGEQGKDCRSCHGVERWKPASAFDHAKTSFPLRGAHAKADCAKCHERATAPEGAPSAPAAPAPTAAARPRLFKNVAHERCTSCHEDRHAGHMGADCASCHDERAWKPSTYDRAKHAKLPLEGAHGRKDCAACHGETLAKPVAGATCASCHEDRRHRGSLGTHCEACHGVESFKAPTFAAAGHAPGRFALTGRHAAVACEACHLDAKGAAAAAPAAHGATGRAAASRPPLACAACHADAHDGRLGSACAACHDATAWGPVAAFGPLEHARTRYPLEGKHAALACERCHGARPTDAAPVAGAPAAPRAPAAPASGAPAAPARGAPAASAPRRARLAVLAPIAHDRCLGCHADAHQGELARRPDGGACEACHDPRGFTPARFDRAEHARTRFPLAGAHAAVACSGCHGPTEADRRTAEAATRGAAPPAPAHASRIAAARLAPASSTCGACHADPHRGQFGPLPAQGRCDACHDAARWTPARSFDHAKTAFPLAGAHAALECARCHAAPSPGAPARKAPAACAECHADPHLRQFARRGDPRQRGCADCHDARAFKPAARFDHARTRFPLDGKHAGLACDACHPRVALGPGLSTVLYRPLAVECAACHVDQHAGHAWQEPPAKEEKR